MLFTSISFLYYFLPIVLIAYFIVPKKAKNFVLFIASMAFYFYGEPKYIFLMLAEIFIAYIGAILIAKYKKKSILTVTLAIHIGLLVFFKYTDFLIANINNIFYFNWLNIFLEIMLQNMWPFNKRMFQKGWRMVESGILFAHKKSVPGRPERNCPAHWGRRNEHEKGVRPFERRRPPR